MASESIWTFYEEDHRRLDGLFSEYQQLRRKNPLKAKKIFHSFRSGVEEHMAWEEAILFSEYTDRLPGREGKEMTEQLLSEHGEIQNLLDRLESALDGSGHAAEIIEKRLIETLADHNRSEENGLYAELDKQLSQVERAELFSRMKQASWDSSGL